MTSVTRYYFAAVTGAAATPDYATLWASTSSASRRKLLAERPTVVSGDLAVVTVNVTESGSDGFQSLARQFVSDPLPARHWVGYARVALPNVSASFRNVLRPNVAVVVLRVVSGDGTTVRGTLATLVDTQAGEATSAYTIHAFGGPLADLAVQAGDRLVVDVGMRFGYATGVNNGGGLGLGFRDDATIDTPFTAGVAPGVGAAWVELELADPPAAPTDLEALWVGLDTFTVGWSPVPDAEGYLVYVNGVLAADMLAPPVLEYVHAGLVPATDYTVEVYAYNGVGVGEPAVLVVTTLAPPPSVPGWYRATVVVGAHTWTAERTDAPQLGPLLPLDLGWELPDDAPGIPAQPNPDTCTLSVLTASALPDVATGTPARVTVWLDNYPGARPFATMAGEVGDLEVFPQQLPDGSHGVLSRMLLVGHETHANAYRVGAQPWPAESGAARAARIMAEAGQLEWSTPIPVGNHFTERAARETPKGDALTQALTEAAVYVAGDYSPPARHLWHANADETGNLDGFTAELVAAETTAIDVLDGAWVNRAASWRRTRRRDGAWVQVTHPGGVTIYGRPGGPPMPPVTLEVTDPDPYADLLLSSLYADAWVSGEWFRVHLHAEDCPPYGLEWFRRDDLSPGFPAASRAVVVDNIQVVPGLFTRYAGMLAGARLVIEPGGRLMLLFRLRPDVPAWSVVTPRWMDEDPADTWADEPPTATWAELRTTPREDT